MRNAESVKARLKNIAKETGRTMQDVLIAYGLERTIMRLTKSNHKETFGHRHTSFDDIAAFEDDYASDPVRQSRWKSFAKKKKVQIDVTLKETIDQIRVFVEPMVDAINHNEKFMKIWKHDSKSWEEK